MEVVNWTFSEDPSISFLAINFFAREELNSLHLSYSLFNSIDLVKSYRYGQVLTLGGIFVHLSMFQAFQQALESIFSHCGHQKLILKLFGTSRHGECVQNNHRSH